MGGDRNERIRERAYQIWQEEGQPEGRGVEHWAQAEREIGEVEGAPVTDEASAIGGEAATGDAPSRGAAGAPAAADTPVADEPAAPTKPAAAV